MPEQSLAADFAGKVAVVTGAAQGIGEATARLMAARGAAGVAIVDRKPTGRDVAADIERQGGKAIFIEADLADMAAVARVIPEADRAFGRIDVLANVAGLTDRSGILDTTPEQYERMFAVNMRAPFFLIQDAAKAMLKHGEGGAIVNVLSVNAYVGAPFLAPYSASKGGLMTLTRNVANALTNDRIRVNAIAPGWVDTPGEHDTLRKYHGAGDDWLEKAEAARPTGKLLKADDLARLICFLAGPQSLPMTGSIVDFEQSVFGGSPGGSRISAYPGQKEG